MAIAGGAQTVQQYLSAGLMDERRLHTAPLILVAGQRLLDGVANLKLEPTEVSGTSLVTHVGYRVTRLDLVKFLCRQPCSTELISAVKHPQLFRPTLAWVHTLEHGGRRSKDTALPPAGPMRVASPPSHGLSRGHR